MVADDGHEIFDLIFQLLDTPSNSRCALKVVQSPSLRRRSQKRRTSHSAMIFSATSNDSSRNGTGITVDTLFSSGITSFTLAVKYSIVVGTIARLSPDDVCGHKIVR